MVGVSKSRFRPAERLLFACMGAVLFVASWEIASRAVGSSLILPAPAQVLGAILALFGTEGLRTAVTGTFGRVLISLAYSIATGALTGMLSWRWDRVEALFSPIITTIRATPVLALILIVMFLLPSGEVPVFTAFLMAYPVIHTAFREGFGSVDPDLKEMASLFRVPARVRLCRLLIPAASSHIAAGIRSGLGLCWKVVVAGEILSQPVHALGTSMQDARLSLETSQTIAWAALTVLLCGLSEFALGLVSEKLRAASAKGALE